MAAHILKEVINPFTSPSKKRWELFQLFGPIFGVVFVIGIISLISWHSYHTTRAGAIYLSNNLLKSEQRYITQEVGSYLSPAMSLSAIVTTMLNHQDDETNARIFMLLGRSVLKNAPQVDSFYLADDTGHFWLVARHGKDYEETTLVSKDGIATYIKHFVNERGTILQTDKVETLGYDPRHSKWYSGALKHENRSGKDRLYWTDPYAYITTHQFVITASIGFQNDFHHHYIFTTNISLNKLTDFVNNLKIGKSGQAIIVDLKSRVIAGHSFPADRTKISNSASPDDIILDQQKQPVFTRSLNLFRIHGDGAGIIKARGQNYVTIASAMPVAKRSWVLLLNAPESDFASFAQVIQKQTVYFSIIVVVLASILAIALIYQGRRVVLYQKKLQTEKEEIQNENNSLLRIANSPGLLDPHQNIPIFTEILAERANAKRASIWRLLPDGERLLCEDMFDYTKDLHGSGIELSRATYEAVFKELSEMHPLTIEDTSQDTRFQPLERLFMKNVNAKKLYFFPIIEQHQPLGLILLEDALKDDVIERTTALVSSVLSLRFIQLLQENNVQDNPHNETYIKDTQTAQPSPLKEITSFILSPYQQDFVPSGLYANVPLLVMEFSETYSEDRHSVKRILEFVANISQKLQEIAENYALFSMQISGSRVIFLGACDEKYNPETALRLADAAVAIRESCLMAIAEYSTNVSFRIGLNIGPIMTGYWGHEIKILNIWGAALSVAELLARTTSDGGQIQVSEKAYQELKSDFLFRPRGSFYFPNLGVTKSYILAGRR